MGLFGSKKDWNIIGIIFEKKDAYRVNGNRAKGGTAETTRDNVRKHPRTIFWAVFDQKGAFLEGDAGSGKEQVPREVVTKIQRDLPKLRTVRTILSLLEKGETDKAAKVLEWDGYPAQRQLPGEDDEG